MVDWFVVDAGGVEKGGDGAHHGGAGGWGFICVDLWVVMCMLFEL